MANVNKFMLRAFCSIYGVSGGAFPSRCKTRFVCEFVSLLVIELVVLIAGQSLQPLPRLDEHGIL